MLRVQHRDSKDIDLFVTDPQLLGYLSPRLAGEAIWDTQNYDESAHTLKLRYEEGEIDFIVAGAVSELPTETFDYGGMPIQMEHPVEIILKKLVYRDTGFKPRDIFDTAVVLQKYEDMLHDHMHLVAKSKAALMQRISGLPDTYFEAAMEELDIRPEWQWIIPKAKQLVTDLVWDIPAPAPSGSR